MLKTGRSLLIYALSAILMVPQAFAAPAAAAHSRELPVTVKSTLLANRIYANPETALLRLTPGIKPEDRAAHLESTHKRMLKGGAKVVNEVIGFQAMMILLGALSFQASREHRELMNLSNGQLPEPAAEGECKGTDTLSALLCSGEFWLGTVGAAGFLAANSIASAVFKKLIKDGGGRLAIFRYVSAMASSAFLMFGATASSFLWTESVKALPEAKQIQQSTGIAGRALQAMSTGRWSVFQASSDGPIFSAILTNMRNILYADSQMRDQWVYNTWRFGMARGEFISAIAVIMAASSSAEVIAAVIAGAVGMAWTAPLIGFVVCLALGFGAMTLLFDVDAPRLMTKMAQGLRSFTAGSAMRRARAEMRILLTSGFSSYQYPETLTNPNYINTMDGMLTQRLERIQNARENYSNVAIEKYYETLMEQKALETKIEIAETTVRNVALQKNLFVAVDDKVMSFEDAKKKLCENGATCEVTIGKQLAVLEKLRPVVAVSKASLTESVNALVGQYQYDMQIVDEISKSDKVLLPAEPITTRLYEFWTRSKALGDELMITLAGSETDVARNMGFEVTPEESAQFQVDLSGLYTQSYIEANMYDAQKKSLGVTP